MISQYQEHFVDDPVAWDFVQAYYRYISAVDDLIDEEISDKAEAVLDVCVLHRKVMAHPFWVAHARELLLLDVLIELSYRDSERLKARFPEASRVWASAGHMMILAVIALTKGEDFARKVSTALRSLNYEEQVKGAH